MSGKYDNLVGSTPEWIHFLESVDEIVANKDSIYSALDKTQEIFGYLKKDCIKHIAKMFHKTTTEVFSIATFVSTYHFEKQGKYTISVCNGAACVAKGSDKILDEFKKQLGIEENQTTSDGLFTLATARCVGACGMAPVVVIGHDLHGNMSVEKVKPLLDFYRSKEVK